jgi:hypothetical protein
MMSACAHLSHYPGLPQVLRSTRIEKHEVAQVLLVGGATRMPKLQQLLSGCFGGRQLCQVLNKDEAVAQGAAICAALLTGAGGDMLQDMLLLDVTAHSLCVEVDGGTVAVLIPRNTTIPTKKDHVFLAGPSAEGQEKQQQGVRAAEALPLEDNRPNGLLEAVVWVGGCQRWQALRCMPARWIHRGIEVLGLALRILASLLPLHRCTLASAGWPGRTCCWESCACRWGSRASR